MKKTIDGPGSGNILLSMRNGHRRILIFAVLAAMLIVGFTGSNCAVLGRKHRMLTTTLDDYVTPESPVVRAALSPLVVPVGVTSLLIDGLVINPIRFLPDSVKFANHTFTSVPFTYVGEIIVFPMRIITWPFLFVGAELVQIAYPF